MAEHPLVLSDEEWQYLVRRLESALEEARVESHHTRTSAYREQVRREQALLRGLLARLGVAVPAGPPRPGAVPAAAAEPVDPGPRGREG